MQELKPPCTGAIEEVNHDGSFRVRNADYENRLFSGVTVELDQFITITHVEHTGEPPWPVVHYKLEITRPTPRG